MDTNGDTYESQFTKDYSWQEDAVDELFTNISEFYNDERGLFERAFVAEVSPSGGKTQFSLKAFRDLLQSGLIDKVIFVAPRDSIKDGFARDSKLVAVDEEFQRGSVDYLNIDEKIQSSYKAGGLENYHGVVVTYQALKSFLSYFRLLARNHRLLFVFDEIHHGRVAGDDTDTCGNEWGSSVADIRSIAHAVICMTGTPVRTDQGDIPFFTYEWRETLDPTTGEADRVKFVKPDFRFTYPEAIRAGVARKLIFRHQDPNVEFTHTKNGKTTQYNGPLSQVPPNCLTYAKKQLFSKKNGCVREMLEEIKAENDRHRSTGDPDAAVLIVVDSTDSDAGFNPLEYVAEVYKDVFGEPAITVESKDGPIAETRIKHFKDSKVRGIIAKSMISEGTSIPRLRSLAILRDIKSNVNYIQVAHRITRNKSDTHSQDAIVIQLYLPEMKAFADAIEKEIEFVGPPKAKPIRCPGCGSELKVRPTRERPCPACGYVPAEPAPRPPVDAEWSGYVFGAEDVGKEGQSVSKYDPTARVVVDKLGPHPIYGGRHPIIDILKAADESGLMSVNGTGGNAEPIAKANPETPEQKMRRHWDNGNKDLKTAAYALAGGKGTKFGDEFPKLVNQCKAAVGITKGHKIERIIRDYPSPLHVLQRYEAEAKSILSRFASGGGK